MAEIYNRTLVETKSSYVIDSTVGQSFGEEQATPCGVWGFFSPALPREIGRYVV